jgi:hypothetical protein
MPNRMSQTYPFGLSKHLPILLALLVSVLSGLQAQDPPIPPPLPADTATMDREMPGWRVMAPDEEEDPFYWAGDGTAISGVWEVMIGVRDLDAALRYYGALGYRLSGTGFLSKLAAEALYGVPSALKSYRLQNGSIDSHGLIRLVVWDKPLGSGVGYAEPGTIGSRLMGMITSDIYRLWDIYSDARRAGEPWLVSEPVRQYVLGDETPRGFFERPVLTREMAVYGTTANHLFMQRYGYTVPGFGSISASSPLSTSEVIQHDFIVRVDSMAQLGYLERVLGLMADGEPSLNGDWLEAPRKLYFLKPGESYWFQSFQSPNNIRGKLRFFAPVGARPDRSSRQRPGQDGITAHTFYTPYLEALWKAVLKEQLRPTPILPNEFGERCFVFRGPEGTTWQIIEKLQPPFHEPIFFHHMQLIGE